MHRSRKPRNTRSRAPWLIAPLVLLALVVGATASGQDLWADTDASVGASPATQPTPAPPAPGAPAPSAPAQNAPAQNAPAGTALALLETIPVKGRSAKTGYDRDSQFGQAWADVDRNGCDTRNDILNRDLADTTKSGACRVLTGVLADPYTATTISFTRGAVTSSAVQIDHVVALMDAWQKGAQQLTQEQRVALANDPINLIAVDGPTNSRKGASDAASWLPPNKTFRCEYVARQVSIKAAYGLWMTSAEKSQIATVLSTCPDQPAFSSDLAAQRAAG
ncbi:HNH endonuclease family protein [Salinibacterium hongtaonis]|uniref:HNH endonuclease family protein n=1 Tax=Homoserinimonas hongtaonis TaxID=2079791 RepID=UPI001E413A9C|nr:HNH endonuclease family protein [Salinibacterium hongtaonis]